MSNLLVIDWDYFFPNPMDGGDYKKYGREVGLYDWGHAETEFLINHVWTSRATAFFMNNVPLPAVNNEWETFIGRFRFSENVVTFFGESNMEAGGLTDEDGRPFEHVYLYDAHHDSGYGIESMAEFRSRETFSCEDWMLVHAAQGTKLHVRYPTWKIHWDTEQDPPADVEVDRQTDRGSAPDEEFDTIYICRSGAWVPPWNDIEFFQFLETTPLGYREELGNLPCEVRDFSADAVRTGAEELSKAMKELDALNKLIGR